MEKSQSKKQIVGTTLYSNTRFIVPETHDMLESLFNPTVKKTLLEVLIVLALASNLGVYYLVDPESRVSVFICLYLFWRLMYNFGIGIILRNQSNHNSLVKLSLQVNYSNENNTLLQKLINYELSFYPDYQTNPVEFNTWLLFRKFVDLVLLQDFTCFIFLFVSCYSSHVESPLLTVARHTIGAVLILFNLWVKLNAHEIVKDYAWYWGDFFFIQDSELIFNGVFEMVPHPMYSIGYIGYYGFALISKSYTVLIISLVAHSLQMIFLILFENPHINKIYPIEMNNFENDSLFHKKPLIGLYNFNSLRISDYLNVIVFGLIMNCLLFSEKYENYLFFLALSTKIIGSLVINTILFRQSNNQSWIKLHFKNDIDDVKDIFQNWVILYNSLLNITYSFLIVLSIKEFSAGTLFFNNWLPLRVILGSLLILLQIWTNMEITSSIGYFGWFYGDFFVSSKSKILINFGIYRFLNNPEYFLGISGIWGAVVMVPSFKVLAVVLLWSFNNFFIINFIEKPHMIRLYGEEKVLKDSGVTKTIKNHLIPSKLQGRLSSSSTSHQESIINRFLNNLLIDKNFNNFELEKIMEYKENYINNNLNYKLSFDNLAKEEDNYYSYLGESIKIKWTAPSNHSNKDWIGLYKLTNQSINKTARSSKGHWLGIHKAGYNQSIGDGILEEDANKGMLEFKLNRLFFEEGLYEFRFHSNEGHDVQVISNFFEIRSFKIEIPPIYSQENVDYLNKQLEEKIFTKVIGEGEDQLKAITDSNWKLISKLIAKVTGLEINWTVLKSYEQIDNISIKLINFKAILNQLSNEIQVNKKNN